MRPYFQALCTSNLEFRAEIVHPDGTSTDQHPTHEYTDSDVYTVTLTIDGSSGSDTETKPDYISVLPQSVLPRAKLFLPLVEH